MRADDRGPRAAADRTGRPYDAAVQTTPAPAASWAVEHHRGTADELHHLEVPERRVLLVMEVTRPALVLGSTQDEATVDRAALDRAGVDLARRRSGGGAVLLVPGEHVWVDVVLPAADALWIDDVGSSSWWLGEAWAAAIAAADVERHGHGRLRPEVHRGGVSERELGRLVCFGATGPGEVSVGGRKLVGLSQRRTRALARFQCVVHRRVVPGATEALLAAPRRTPELAAALRDGVTDLVSLGIDDGWGVVEGLLAEMP